MAAAERESTGGVLGVAFGLAVFAGAVGYLASSRVGELDGRAQLEEWFEVGELPFGLEVEGGLRAGTRTVLLSNPDAAPEAPKKDVPEDELEGDYDWSAVPDGPAGTEPLEAVVVVWPDPARAVEEIERLFAVSSRGSDDDGEAEVLSIDAKGGRAVMDRGRLDWDEYRVLYVYERELEPGGTFRDVVRVNLTLPGRACVLAVRWPRGHPASLEHVERVAGALRPR